MKRLIVYASTVLAAIAVVVVQHDVNAATAKPQINGADCKNATCSDVA